MKTLRNLLLLFIAVLFVTSCEDREFDKPAVDVPTYDGESNTTIQELKQKYAGQSLVEITEPIVIRGIVVANDISGNIYKQIQLQDETGGICIAIDRNNIYEDYRVGQEVFVECEGLYIGLYSGYPQLGYKYSRNNDDVFSIGQVTWELFEEKAHLNDFPQPDLVEADTITIDQVNNSYVGKLVTIKNVSFENGGKDPFSVPGAGGAVQTLSKMIVSASNSSSKLTVRNSSAANFASFTMPAGVGSVTGILSVYNSTFQLTFRDSTDCSPMNFSAGQGNGTKESPWSVGYALSNQDGSMSGWIQGYIVGSVVPGINDANPVNGNEDIIFDGTFTNNTVVLAASPDVKDWTKYVIVNLPAGSDIRNQVSLADTPANLGKLLKVTGTLQNALGAAGLTVKTGSSSEFVLDSSVQGGSGTTKDSPLSVSEGISKQGQTDTLWVKGYIVGCVKQGSSTVASAADVFMGVTSGFNSSTNVLIADNANETDYTKCIAVNLPAGMPLRSNVNLLDNPSNIGKVLIVKGKLRTYFGIAGSRDNKGSDYVLEGDGNGGGTPPVTGTTILDIPFDTDLGGFTAQSVLGNEVWSLDAAYNYVRVSGYNGGNKANEDWLISPAMDLMDNTSATVSFSHTINKGDLNNITSNHTMWVSEDYNTGDPSSATWTQVEIASYPAGNSWAFVPSGNIALPSSVMGKANVHVAFKYLCSTAESATWEVRDFKVLGK